MNITISMTPHPKEENFTSAELMLAMGLAPVGKDEKATAFERLASAISTFSATLSTTKCKGQAFSCRHYTPFFAAVSHADLTEAMVCRTLKSAGVQGKDAWAAANAAKLTDFDDFLVSYSWPSK